MMKRTVIFLFAVVLIAGVGWAQEVPVEGEEVQESEVAKEEEQGGLEKVQSEEGVIEEVIVTARKKGESLDDVPLTIQAFTADAIQEMGIVSVENVADLTPGIHFSNYQGTRDEPEVKFRGMDVGTKSRAIQNSSSFIDGVYLPGSSQVISMEMVERVEVVKGPQSAFFGRQTFGGALNLITKKPTFDWAGSADATIGENSRVDLNAAISGPISEKFSFRVFGRYFDYGGPFENTVEGSEDLGALQTTAISGAIDFAPSDRMNFDLRIFYSQDRDGGGAFAFFPSSILNCGPFGGYAEYYCGELTPDLANPIGYDTTVDLTTEGANWPMDEFGMDRDFMLATLGFDISLGDGDTVLSSYTSYLDEDLKAMQDFTGTNSLLLYYAQTDTLISQEFRLSGTSEHFDWLVGAYYLDAEYVDNGNGWGCASPYYYLCYPFTGGAVRGHFDLGASDPRLVENTALFGSITWRVSDAISLSLEGRGARDEIDQGVANNGRELKDTWNSFTPRFIFDWKPSPSSTVYFNAAQGNKAGGFNVEIANMADSAIVEFEQEFGATVDIPEETLWNYELGYKGVFADGKHRFTAAAYFMDWDSQRLRQFEQGFDTNGDGVVDENDNFQVDYDTVAGQSEIKGFELFYWGAFGNHFQFNAGFNYNDAKYKDFNDSTHNAVYGDPNAAGKTIPRSPKYSGTLGLAFNHAVGSGAWDFYARADMSYVGSTYTWSVNLAETGVSNRTNVRLGFRSDRWDFGAWVNNVTDNDNMFAIRRFTDFWTFGQGFWGGVPTPREFGVTARIIF